MVKISREQYIKDKNSIISEIKANPSLDVKEIAKKLGFSEQKIYKIIREYKSGSQENDRVLGSDNSLRQFFVLIKINEYSQSMSLIYKSFKSIFIENYQKKYFKIDYSFQTYGKSNYIFHISSKEIVDVKMFCNKIKKMIGPDLQNLEIIEILKPFTDKDHLEN